MMAVAQAVAVELFKLAAALMDELPLLRMNDADVEALVSSKVNAMLGPLNKVCAAHA